MNKEKVKVAIIGPGNIGTDLLYKIMNRSSYMEVALMIGIYEESEGLKRAGSLGIKTSAEGINAIRDEGIEIAFDATSAHAHLEAAIGPYVCPVVNLEEHIEESNINLITCGGQATLPIVAAVNSVANVKYAEVVATIASKSAGPGTRQNIDEFTKTTARGIEKVGGALVERTDEKIIKESIEQMIARVREYVPGYRLRLGPLFDDNKVTTMIEVEGAGDFLPKFAGNLDIETSAAVAIGERVAEKLVSERVKGYEK